MDAATGTYALLIYCLGLAAIALLISWILLPFALFGVKPLLRKLLAEVVGLRHDVKTLGSDSSKRQTPPGDAGR